MKIPLNDEKTKLSILKKVIPLYWPEDLPNRMTFVSCLTLTILSTVIDLAQPLLLKEATDFSHSRDDGNNNTNHFLLVYCFGYLFSMLIGRLHIISVANVSLYVENEMTLKTVRHMHDISYDMQLKVKPSDVQDVISHTSSALSEISYYGLLDLAPAILGLILSGVVVSKKYDPLYGFLLYLTSGIFLMYTMLTNSMTKLISRDLQSSSTELTNKISEIISEYDLIHYYSKSNSEFVKLSALTKNNSRLSSNKTLLSEKITAGQNMILTAGLIFILYLFSKNSSSNSYTLGDMLLMLQYLKEFIMPLSRMGYIIKGISSSLSGIQRSFDLLEMKMEIPVVSQKHLCSTSYNYLEFKDVSFGYDENIILNKLSFAACKGQSIAILGESGCGKSTIAKLLFRFYEPQSDTILIDGCDIRDLDRDLLRDNICIAPQKPSFVHGTLNENLRYANNKASIEDINRLIQRVGLQQYISGLPKQYETLVEQGAPTISGGEKTRISLVRALLKKAAIYILDEPTTGLDDDNRKKVISVIKNHPNKQNSITIIITHCPELAASADKVICLPSEKYKSFSVKKSVNQEVKKENHIKKNTITSCANSFFNKKVASAAVLATVTVGSVVAGAFFKTT